MSDIDAAIRAELERLGAIEGALVHSTLELLLAELRITKSVRSCRQIVRSKMPGSSFCDKDRYLANRVMKEVNSRLEKFGAFWVDLVVGTGPGEDLVLLVLWKSGLTAVKETANDV